MTLHETPDTHEAPETHEMRGAPGAALAATDALSSAARDDALADILAANGRLDAPALARARRAQHGAGDALPSVLLKLGLLSERDLAEALATLYDLPLLGAADYPTAPLYADHLSLRFLRDSKVMPLHQDETGLHLAMADPGDRFAREALGLLAGRPVHPRVAVPAELEAAIERLYAAPAAETATGAATGTAADLDAVAGLDGEGETDVERLKDEASEAPVVRLVNRIIAEAIEERASDIHLEPFENRLRLRYRIDGVLREGDSPPQRLRAAIVSRIKIMAGLNIAERRLPQDGRIKLAVRGTPIDLRISTLPALHGESVVMRLLDRENVSLDFDALGIDGANRETLMAVLDRPNGIFLVTGPTGSGKTTTLYAALVKLNRPETKIITVEDPIEYQLDGVNQIQVKPDIGLDFAQVLRAILRQDPDVILIGEIRDLETAQIAAQAALTGHLVLSTLHTNNAAASVTRLMDMGVEDYLVTATLNGVAAQRLVRRLCPECRVPRAVSPELARELGLDPDGSAAVHGPGGCANCNHTGYRGRISLLETLVLDDEMRRAILQRSDARALHRHAVAGGLRTLYHDGLDKVRAGLTSIEEVLRVTRDA